MMKPISLKIEANQLKLLDAVAEETHIPKSTLIRQGIALILRQHREDVISSELQKKIDTLLKEDQELLNRLAKA